MILLVCTLCLALEGCVSRPGKAESTPSPTPGITASPTAAPTPAPTPMPTPEPTPTPEPVHRLLRGDTVNEYTLFTGTSVGAAALRTWLLGEGAEITAGFIPERVLEPAFSLKAAPVTQDIPTATDATRHVKLAVDALILESGLLGEVLPDFEDRCGYVVEVITGEESTLAGWADSASADAVLLGGKMAASVNRRGFADVTALFSTEYILESSAGAEEQNTSGSVPGEGGES